MLRNEPPLPCYCDDLDHDGIHPCASGACCGDTLACLVRYGIVAWPWANLAIRLSGEAAAREEAEGGNLCLNLEQR